MSLTTGRGPLSGRPRGRFDRPMPSGVVYVEPFNRRVRGQDGECVLIDSERVLLVHRPDRPPTYAFPAEDVSGVRATDEPAAPGHVTVDWRDVPEWFEEEERVEGHPRNPYHRVDCLRARRPLRAAIDGEVLVDTDEVVLVDETGLGPRLYVSPKHVQTHLLVRSEHVTYCPYKGWATYWTVVVGGTEHRDVAWSYDDPLPECSPIAGMLSFYTERLDQPDGGRG